MLKELIDEQRDGTSALQDEWVSWGQGYLLLWALHSPRKSLLQGSVALSSKYTFRLAALSVRPDLENTVAMALGLPGGSPKGP